jgi:hypothetical protein
MKKIILILSIAFTALATPSCKDDSSKIDKEDVVATGEVPAVVKSAFVAKYPNAVDVVWENAKEDGKKTYKAKFKLDGKDWKTEYAEDGTVLSEKEDK